MSLIGQELAFFRIQRGLTQAELARRSGIPQANISNIEKGKQDFTVSTLVKLCGALQVEPAECFKKQVPSPPLRWTRRRLERLSRSVWDPKILLSSEEGEIRGLLIDLIPEIPKRSRSAKKAYQAWYALKTRVGDQTVKLLVNRIREKKPD